MRKLLRYLRGNAVPVLVGAGLTAALLTVVVGGEHALSSTAFCTSCHSMTYPAEELAESTHYGALGANPECKDCHVPQGLGNFALAVSTHVVDGLRGMVGEAALDLSTADKFDEHRLEFAHNARMNLKAWDSVTCRSCHRDPRPPGKSARTAHEKIRTEGATCIDCHQNLVHKRVPETDLDRSRAEGRMVLRERK